MTLYDAFAFADAAIDAVPAGGLANGIPYVNTAMPATSHIRAHLKWPLKDDGKPVGLVDHICAYARVDLDAASRDAVSDKAAIDVAVIIAVARSAAWRYYQWTLGSMNIAEVATIPTGTAEAKVHADHEAAVTDALNEWATVAARYMGLFYYNAVSYETSAHHHLPAKTKRLASTTVLLAGLKDWISGNEEREGSVFHDMFHPLSDSEKSTAARRVAAKQHLSDLKFDNLRKRIPVKAPDSGIAINYPVLYRKACAYRHNPEDLPRELEPPENLDAAIAAYENSPTAAELVTTVQRLRAMSEKLAEPSAYLAGFILGREAAAVEDVDLDLRTASRTTTILGSPAYLRAAGEFSGAFTAGKESGFQPVASSVPDQVLPRCVQAVAEASGL